MQRLKRVATESAGLMTGALSLVGARPGTTQSGVQNRSYALFSSSAISKASRPSI
jgi:hypothetical protein